VCIAAAAASIDTPTYRTTSIDRCNMTTSIDRRCTTSIARCCMMSIARCVALQVEFERQILKPAFHLIGYRLWV
jgi:hypothetical protein